MTSTSHPPAEPGDRTLLSALSSRDNALNFLRLVLAILVILGHGFQILGLEPSFLGDIQGQAVHGFFAISGFLILSSGLTMRTLPFLWRRFLRIYPGYLVAVCMVAFVFSPLSTLWEPETTWTFREALYYVRGAIDLEPSQHNVGDTLASVPWTHVWNISLWTLFYEALAYLGVAVLCLFPWFRSHALVSTSFLVAVSTVFTLSVTAEDLAASIPTELATTFVVGSTLWTYFLWGMLARVLADRIRPSLKLGSVLVIVYLVVSQQAAVMPLVAEASGFPLLTFGILLLGASLSVRIGSRNDISYGVYIYGFPVQQLLLVSGATMGVWSIAVIECLLVTLPLAYASWVLIEKPALRFKGLVPARSWLNTP